MEDTELPLFIPVSSVDDFFQCSICMCSITSTVLTSCGHRFCHTCISEWVNRQHKCPCCNTVLQGAQLIKDHQFDSLISTIETEKEKSVTKYFDALINTATENEDGDSNLEPVERVLKKHLKESLAQHDKYFRSLKKSYENRLSHLESQTRIATADLLRQGLSQDEVSRRTEALEGTLSTQKSDLLKEMTTCSEMVAEAYDKFLTSHIPNLDILPVTVSIFLAQKNIRLKEIVFNPTDSVKDVRDKVETYMAAHENPLAEWGADVKYFLFDPFAKGTQCEMDQIMTEMINSGTPFPDVQLVTEGGKLGLQYGMKPGSEIVIHGTVKTESDLPKKCFVETFAAGDHQKVDYFSCQDCGFKWVCRSCMSVCHLGHDIKPYIMQHQPAWACCYCPKKKKCVLQTSSEHPDAQTPSQSTAF